jgi:hypothetical protein
MIEGMPHVTLDDLRMVVGRFTMEGHVRIRKKEGGNGLLQWSESTGRGSEGF